VISDVHPLIQSMLGTEASKQRYLISRAEVEEAKEVCERIMDDYRLCYMLNPLDEKQRGCVASCGTHCEQWLTRLVSLFLESKIVIEVLNGQILDKPLVFHIHLFELGGHTFEVYHEKLATKEKLRKFVSLGCRELKNATTPLSLRIRSMHEIWRFVRSARDKTRSSRRTCPLLFEQRVGTRSKVTATGTTSRS
jgi:hypothetical protein